MLVVCLVCIVAIFEAYFSFYPLSLSSSPPLLFMRSINITHNLDSSRKKTRNMNDNIAAREQDQSPLIR